MRTPTLLLILLAATLAAFPAAGPVSGQESPEPSVAELFAQQRYKEVLERLDELDAGREREWYRLAAERRIAVLQGDAETRRLTSLDLLRFAEQPQGLPQGRPQGMMDDWSALAVSELLDPFESEHHGSLQRLVPRAVEHWENAVDIPAAIDPYLQLFERLLSPGQQLAAPLDEMWANLVSAPAPRADLLRAGAAVLVQQPRSAAAGRGRVRWTPPYHLQSRVSDANAFRRQVAADLLGMQPEGWLIAICELTLGDVDESAGEFRSAAQHYEAAMVADSEANSAAVGEAKARLERLLAPIVQLRGPALFQPGSAHIFQFQWRNLDSWEIRVERIDPSSLAPPDDGTMPYQLHQMVVSAPGEVVQTLQRRDDMERRARESADGGEPHVWRNDEVEFEPLPTGLYRLRVIPKPADETRLANEQQHIVGVGQLGLVSQTVGTRGSERLELWLVNMATGEPIPNASVMAQVATGRHGQLQWTQRALSTDANGIATLPMDIEELRGAIFLGSVGDEPVMMIHSSLHSVPFEGGVQEVAIVLTDRPLYRPGESVSLQAFVRERRPAERAVALPDRTSELELRVLASDGNELHKELLSPDGNGAVETTFEIPEGAALGRYSVQLRWTDESHPFAHDGFQVDQVRLPEFRVRAAIDAGEHTILGDSLTVSIDAEYLFGGAVSGNGEVVVRRTPQYPWEPPIPGVLRPMQAGMHSKIAPWFQQPEEVMRSKFALDAEGRAQIRIATNRDQGNVPFYRYSIEARVIDESRREESGGASIRLGLTEFQAWLGAERWVVAPGDKARVRVQLRDANAQPVAADVQLVVTKLGGDQESTLRRQELSVPESGEAEFQFEPNEVGHYRVSLTARDSRGNEIEAQCAIWCADPNLEQVVHAMDGLTLIAEKDAVYEDDVARVLLVSEFPGASVYVARAHAGAVESEVLRLTGSTRLLEFPVTALHRPSFEIRASTARDYRLHGARLEIQAPPWQQQLDVQASFEQESYAPGEDATLELTVLDAAGNPSQSPVTVAVIDGAVLEVLPRPELDPVARLFSFAPLRVPPQLVSVEMLGGYRDEEGKTEYDVGRRDDLQRGAMGDVVEESTMFKSAARASNLPAAAAPAELPNVELRTDFRTTVLWRTAVFPGRDGRARVPVPLAQSLTEWNALALSIDSDSRAGVAEATTRTRKDLMIRLNHPRVFRERDRLLLAATVHNETDEDLVCTVDLLAEPLVVEKGEQDIIVPAGEQRRVQWWASVPDDAAALRFEREAETNRLVVWPARCRVRASVRSSVTGDAFERFVDLIPFGTPLNVTASTELRGNGSLELTLPPQRVLAAEQATLQLSPSVLSTCIEVLPYLAEYPYGCTEQTLSRFVPAAAVRHVISVLGASTERIDPELDAKIEVGLERLAEFQRPDGGWGWWKEAESDPYMTAHALVALARAAQSDIEVDESMLERGRNALRSLLPKLELRPDDLAYALYALAGVDRQLHGEVDEDDTMLRHAQKLLQERDELRDYSRALLAIYLHASGALEDAQLLIQFLPNTVQRDEKYGTAHWGQQSGYYWRGDGAVESTAFALQALLAVDPDSEFIPAAARWLVQNRRGHRWDSTRASAHAIYALCDFAQANGETASDYTLTAWIGDVEIASMKVDGSNLFDVDGRFEIDPGLFRGDTTTIDLRMDGEGVCYASAVFSTYSRDDDPEPTANWIDVRREIVRLRPTRSLGGTIRQVEQTMADGDSIASGDRIQVKLLLTAHSDLEYLAIEDPRPAGCEPVETLSGWFHNETFAGRREVREDRTAFFPTVLTEGEHELVYELRAESPGVYHAMPTQAYAMYLPDVSGTSKLFRLKIVTSPEDEVIRGR